MHYPLEVGVLEAIIRPVAVFTSASNVTEEVLRKDDFIGCPSDDQEEKGDLWLRSNYPQCTDGRSKCVKWYAGLKRTLESITLEHKSRDAFMASWCRLGNSLQRIIGRKGTAQPHGRHQKSVKSWREQGINWNYQAISQAECGYHVAELVHSPPGQCSR